MRNIKFILVIVVTILVSCSKDSFSEPPTVEPPNEATTGDEVILDMNTTYQTIHHFGSSDAWSTEIIGRNWPNTEKELISKLLFSKETDQQGQPEGIGLSMWRTNVGSGSANQQNNGFSSDAWFRSSECTLKPDGTYDWTQQEGSRWFLSKAKEYDVENITGFVTSAPYFFTKNGYTFSTSGITGLNLLDNKYDDFAQYLAEYVKYNTGLGIPIDYLSLINEPQWGWQYDVGAAAQEGTPCTNDEAKNLAEAVNTVFQAENIPTKLILPEAAHYSFLYGTDSSSPNASNQINDFWNSGSSKYLGSLNSVEKTVAGHAYWNNPNVETAISKRKALYQSLESANADFWQTEYSILGGDYLQNMNETDLKEIDYSLWLARIIHWDLAIANATGWSFWTSLSRVQCCDHKYRFGLLNWYPNSESRSSSFGTIEITKNLWALGNYSRFVRPGMVRFKIDNKAFSSDVSASNNFMISGFINSGANEIVLVCINYQDSSRDIKLKTSGEELNIEGASFITYTTSSNKNLFKSTTDIDSVTIPGKSIVTLTAKLK